MSVAPAEPLQPVLPPHRPLVELPPGTTTLLVRNIPAHFTQDKLLHKWVPDGSFNFLSLLCSHTEGHSLGHAFVNFVSHEAALTFRAAWQGRFLGRKKSLHIIPARVQGYLANLQQVGTAALRVADDELLPATFSGTVRLNTRREVLAAVVAAVNQLEI